MNETFEQRLRAFRKRRKMTQVALAKVVGVPNHYISHYERDNFTPSLPTLEWLCKGLGVKASDLLGF